MRAIEDNTSKMEREKTKADELEESLSSEETILEQIRDSLKGIRIAVNMHLAFILTLFHRQDSRLP